MRISVNWLREWLSTSIDSETLQAGFTAGGLECELESHCPDTALDSVVVAQITSREAHPSADRLRVCQVDAGDGNPVQVVCGAANAAAGMKVALARPGATLPGGQKIGAAELRGVASAGMLCSAAELGLGEGSAGILALDDDAPVGQALRDWLQLDDSVLHFELTPNRGDCLSVAGLAREGAVLFADASAVPSAAQNVDCSEGITARQVAIADRALCPVYCARVIDGVDATRKSPDWLRERLRRSGLRSVSAIVDVTNLVMLELGQPLHAFDDARLDGTITVRAAQAGERLRLLNGNDYTLDARDLVIADGRGAVALAGVMGGESSEVTSETTRIFLEAACFLPAAVAGTGRRHKLHSDAVHRFERGVDPALAQRALARATALIQQLCGGEAGAEVIAGSAEGAVSRPPIGLQQDRLAALLGSDVAPPRVKEVLTALGMTLQSDEGGWQVAPPGWRFDVTQDVDLIEEVARVVGYDAIGAEGYSAALQPQPTPEARQPQARLRASLGARGFQELVCYSFVDPQLEQRLQPQMPRIDLDNPIAAPMACMRTTLWSGLLPVMQYNASRQQRRQRVYELARVYLPVADGEAPREIERLAFAMLGPVADVHWSGKERNADFFDIKGELEALLPQAVLAAAEHPALHPGRSASVRLNGELVGWIGELHPAHAAALDLPRGVLLCEIDADCVLARNVPTHPRVPEFPASRRDLALEVDESVQCADLLQTLREAAPDYLEDVLVFDLYQGEALKKGCKGIGLGLIFQDYSRTLTQDLVESATRDVAAALQQRWGASIRG